MPATLPAEGNAAAASCLTMLRNVPGETSAAMVGVLLDLPTAIEGPTSLRAFMDAHHGETVETVQLDVPLIPGARPGGWMPGPRRIDAQTAATYVLFHDPADTDALGSRRDYAGTRVLLSDDRSMMLADAKWSTPERARFIVYRIAQD